MHFANVDSVSLTWAKSLGEFSLGESLCCFRYHRSHSACYRTRLYCEIVFGIKKVPSLDSHLKPFA